mgnify:CR=1 FL=1
MWFKNDGEPLLPVHLVADARILEGPQVAFTAGTHTDSLVLSTADWLRVAAPVVRPLIKPPPVA